MKSYRITAEELTQKYFDFFSARGHCPIGSASLVPEADPTALFVSAGMQPLVPYLMGAAHPAGRRLVNKQKCFRSGDIDQVGNTTHLTFFEMLGNWSLGDYFKEEMVRWSWAFLTDPKWLGIPPQRLYVTVFAGDNGVGRDVESIELWRQQFAQVGIDAEGEGRIYALGRVDNWWGPVGPTGPCGPDTEMFYCTDKPLCGPECRPGCSCGRYVEIWNDVFMEYNKLADGSFERLKQRNVDTGMGLARVLVALNGLAAVAEIDTLFPLVEQLEGLSGLEYGRQARPFGIIADHANAACHLAADGVVPANVDRGYVLRRLIRRSLVHARRLGIEQSIWPSLFEQVRKVAGQTYAELERGAGQILSVLLAEEEQFGRTLEQGLRRFNQWADSAVEGRRFDGGRAFELFATYGLPLEMTRELAAERGLHVDIEAFEREFGRHQERSRQSAAAKFSGGLADHSPRSIEYHTATHLLHAALRLVLGDEVEQRGSNITPQRLRFDFSFGRQVEAQELAQVEALVNKAIERDYPIESGEMSLAAAQSGGAIGLFGDRYGERVTVYSVGALDQRPAADGTGPTFSKEICGGPHVRRTGGLGRFKIVKEQSASRGVRRIRGVLIG